MSASGTTSVEIANCRPYLEEELAIVRPRLIIGLGEDARDVLSGAYPKSRRLDWPLVSVSEMTPPTTDSPDLLFPTHPGAFRWKPTDIRADLTEQFVTCLARCPVGIRIWTDLRRDARP